MSEQRPARPGEYCSCGRQAIRVFVTDDREVGHCGIDGVRPVVPCVFCGADDHPITAWEGGIDWEPCPDYTIRPKETTE